MQPKYKVIGEDDSLNHTIEPYEFKRFDYNDENSHIMQTHEGHEDLPSDIRHDKIQPTVIDSAYIEKLEDLLKTMNSMESQINSQSSQFSNYLQEDKKRSYEDGLRVGREQALESQSSDIEQLKTRLLEAIEQVNNESKKFLDSISRIESELTTVAIDIAKQVVESEISKESSSIATALSKKLIQDLKDATEIVIKVNPQDFVYLKENMSEDSRVKIESDKAIAKGGVVIVSDAGNIDGSIKERFSRVKSTLFEE